MDSYPGKQYAIFRILMGLWLIWYFSNFIPYAGFYFGKDGAFPNNISWAFIPNIFNYFNTPILIKSLLSIFIIFSLLFVFGIFRRTSAFILWFGWASVTSKNPFIFTPIDGYVGWLLLASVIIPSGEPLSFRPQDNWKMPREIYLGAWFVFALSYSFSGYIKLSSQSWLNGDSLTLIFNGPLIRPWVIFLGDLPQIILKILTWGALSAELLFFPLALIKKLRPYLWWGATLFHLSIFFIIGFGDLSLAMLLSQIFIFDIRWMPRLKGLQLRAKMS